MQYERNALSLYLLLFCCYRLVVGQFQVSIGRNILLCVVDVWFSVVNVDGGWFFFPFLSFTCLFLHDSVAGVVMYDDVHHCHNRQFNSSFSSVDIFFLCNFIIVARHNPSKNSAVSEQTAREKKNRVKKNTNKFGKNKTFRFHLLLNRTLYLFNKFFA